MMEMTFYQLQLEAGWVRGTKKITATVRCENCHRDVPCERWDKGLDTFFKAEKKKITVKTSFKTGKVGKFLIWLNILFFGAIFLLLAGIFIYHRIGPEQMVKAGISVQQAAKFAASLKAGDIVLVFLFDGHKQVLYKITAIDADLVKAVASDKSINVPANASEVPVADAD